MVVVPTMGALHEGHRVLIEEGRRRAGRNGKLVVTIFVNPSQFEKKEDLEKYPKRWKSDVRMCREAGVDCLFAPEVKEMYTEDHSVWIDEEALGKNLCGASRPGHFRGVCTIVGKLFHLVSPDIAVFGQKDYQQLAIIRRMVRDLNFPVEIVACATVRESDGLAMSSRNLRLEPEHRERAPILYQVLEGALIAWREGEKSAAILKRKVRIKLQRCQELELDYLEIVQGESLEKVKKVERGDVMAVAVKFGSVRLIDNIIFYEDI